MKAAFGRHASVLFIISLLSTGFAQNESFFRFIGTEEEQANLMPSQDVELPGGFNVAPIVGNISKDGTTVVGGSGEPGDVAFSWTVDGGLAVLGDLEGGAVRSWAEGVSADGSYIVGSSEASDGIVRAFRWSQETGMEALETSSEGGTSSATAVTPEGDVVIGISEISQGVEQAFTWSQETGTVPLGVLSENHTYSEAYAVTPDGSTVIGQSGDNGFIWTEEGGMRPLVEPISGSIITVVSCALTDDASIITGALMTERATGGEAFLLTSENLEPLGDLPGGSFESIMYAISGDGAIAVGSGTTKRGDEAIFWTRERGLSSLKDFLVTQYEFPVDEWILESAKALSADGHTVSGVAVSPDGERRGWIASVPNW